MEREQIAVLEAEHPASQRAARARQGVAARRGADELDDALARRVPRFRRVGAGRRGHRRRRQRLRRPLSRRHRRDDRPLAAGDRRGGPASGSRKGITAMLPTEDAVHVGEEMKRRFGMPNWQFSLSATDANRFVVRIAREITGRPKILVHNHCYHGSVDETVADARRRRGPAARGQRRRRPSTPRRRPGSSRSTTSRGSSASSPKATSPASWSSRR